MRALMRTSCQAYLLSLQYRAKRVRASIVLLEKSQHARPEFLRHFPRGATVLRARDQPQFCLPIGPRQHTRLVRQNVHISIAVNQKHGSTRSSQPVDRICLKKIDSVTPLRIAYANFSGQESNRTAEPPFQADPSRTHEISFAIVSHAAEGREPGVGNHRAEPGFGAETLQE